MFGWIWAGISKNKGFLLLGHPVPGSWVRGMGFSCSFFEGRGERGCVDIVPVGSFGLKASRVLCQGYMEIIRKFRGSGPQVLRSLGSLSSFHLSESPYVCSVLSMGFSRKRKDPFLVETEDFIYFNSTEVEITVYPFSRNALIYVYFPVTVCE